KCRSARFDCNVLSFGTTESVDGTKSCCGRGAGRWSGRFLTAGLGCVTNRFSGTPDAESPQAIDEYLGLSLLIAREDSQYRTNCLSLSTTADTVGDSRETRRALAAPMEERGFCVSRRDTITPYM